MIRPRPITASVPCRNLVSEPGNGRHQTKLLLHDLGLLLLPFIKGVPGVTADPVLLHYRPPTTLVNHRCVHAGSTSRRSSFYVTSASYYSCYPQVFTCPEYQRTNHLLRDLKQDRRVFTVQGAIETSPALIPTCNIDLRYRKQPESSPEPMDLHEPPRIN